MSYLLSSYAVPVGVGPSQVKDLLSLNNTYVLRKRDRISELDRSDLRALAARKIYE